MTKIVTLHHGADFVNKKAVLSCRLGYVGDYRPSSLIVSVNVRIVNVFVQAIASVLPFRGEWAESLWISDPFETPPLDANGIFRAGGNVDLGSIAYREMRTSADCFTYFLCYCEIK